MHGCVIIILVLIFLLGLFLKSIWNHSELLRGGEFRKYTSGIIGVVPSISLIEVLDSLQTSASYDVKLEKLNAFDYLLSRTIQRLQSLNSFKWKDQIAYCDGFKEAHLVSDANIDIIGLILKEKSIEIGFACCEWHGDSFNCEPNALITTYKDGLYRINRGIERIQQETDFLSFLGYSPVDEINAINEASYISIPKSDGKSFNLSLEMVNELYGNILGNKDLTIEEQNKKIKSTNQHYRDEQNKILIKYLFKQSIWEQLELKAHESQSIRVKRLASLTKPFKPDEARTIVKGELIRCLYNRLRLFQELKDIPNLPQVEIYLEYSYGKSRKVNSLYPLIHKHTINILHEILIHHQSRIKSNNVNIYCLRFQMETKDVDDPTSELKAPSHDFKELLHIPLISNINNENIDVFFYDQCHYKNIRIPNTTSEFSYDEQLYFQLDEEKYSVQIEHSENGLRHKSNMIEFLARNISPIVSFPTLLNFFQKNLPEIMLPDNHFRWNYIDEQIPIHDSVIYKAFGDEKAQHLFQIKPSNFIH